MLMHSADALAWGLATHIYFSQLLIWAVPLLDPRFRAAAKRLPQLVLAGACLPDLALVGRHAKTEVFDNTHCWEQAARLLEHADSDEARAMALGYASHLFVDIIAHNHFVPAHEHLWLKMPVVTHAVSEWAMDAHLARHVFASPPHLLGEHHATLAAYAETEFACTRAEAEKALRYLRRATRVLYTGRLHVALYAGAKRLDSRLTQRFDYYISETGTRLPQINRLLAGEAPTWQADLASTEQPPPFQVIDPAAVRGSLPLPVNLFG
jgi:hypothetical protein